MKIPDKYFKEEYEKMYACCDCGYYRLNASHPNIRCPITGRCGYCGNDWPCEDHINLVPEKKRAYVSSQAYLRKSKA